MSQVMKDILPIRSECADLLSRNEVKFGEISARHWVPEERVARAAYIAQACNAYPALIEALEASVKAGEQLEKRFMKLRKSVFEPLRAELNAILDATEIARAALKKHRGEA